MQKSAWSHVNLLARSASVETPYAGYFTFLFLLEDFVHGYENADVRQKFRAGSIPVLGNPE